MGTQGVKAVFLGWQTDSTGRLEAFPMFNIIGGERNGSTVTEPTLKILGIETPKNYPSLEEWRKHNER